MNKTKFHNTYFEKKHYAKTLPEVLKPYGFNEEEYRKKLKEKLREKTD